MLLCRLPAAGPRMFLNMDQANNVQVLDRIQHAYSDERMVVFIRRTRCHLLATARVRIVLLGMAG